MHSFRYDPFGRRIQKSFTTGANPPTTTPTNYLYDGDNSIEEVDPNGSVLARYSQGLNIDEPLAMLRGSTSYYQADGLGSVTSLSNAAGALAQTYTFDSFGKQTAASGSLTNTFRYTGRESDVETGLYYYRARYYDPGIGRFLAEDPNDQGTLGEATNLYRYAENSPTNYGDPYGLFTMKSGRVPWPSLPIQALLDCIEYKTGLKLVVTSTSDSHPPTDLHTLGGAVDLRYPPDPNDVNHILCAAKDCGAGYALNEKTKKPESPHWDGPHIHLQIPPSKSGKHGDLPSGNCCEK